MGVDRLTANNFTICTSSTRPANATDGTMIYETDTNIAYYYDGAAWRLNGIQTVGHTSLGSTAASMSITLPSITNGLHLLVFAMTQGNNNYAWLQPNGDNTGTNYWEEGYYGQNASAVAFNNASPVGGRISYADAGATYWGAGYSWVFDYASAKNKTIQSILGTPVSLGTSAFTMDSLCIWKSTAAITSLTVRAASGNFNAGSMMSVQVVGSV